MFTCQVSWHVAGHASSPICPLPLALSQTHPALLLLLGHHFLLLLHVQQPSHPSSVPHTLFLHRRFLLFGIFHSSSHEILIFPAFLFSRAVSFVVFSSREQRNFSTFTTIGLPTYLRTCNMYGKPFTKAMRAGRLLTKHAEVQQV